MVAVAFEGETSPELQGLVDEIVWLRVGQLSKLINSFKKTNISQCVMLGQVAPRNLFDFRPDLKALGILFRLKEKNAHTIFGAIRDELRREGIELIEPIPWMKDMMPGQGYQKGPKLSPEQLEDVSFGFGLAKEVSRLEIGQTVVVKKGTVLAVEGFEGTDACLKRGGGLAGSKGLAVAVKVAKPNHDMRFDIPCVGLQTLETCAGSGIAVLAFEPDKTLLLDMEDLEKAAVTMKVSLVAAGPAPVS